MTLSAFGGNLPLTHQMTEHKGQDASVPRVVHFDGRINAESIICGRSCRKDSRPFICILRPQRRPEQSTPCRSLASPPLADISGHPQMNVIETGVRLPSHPSYS